MRSPDGSPQSPLAVSLLGHARFAFRGAPYKFSAPPRTFPLLGMLLLNRGTYLLRDAIAFSLWPDETEEAARTNLRRHLNYLKNALPPTGTPWFLADAETVTWNDDSSTWFDVDAFRLLIALPETMSDAVDVYRGDLLAGTCDDWLLVERDRLRSRFLGALETLLIAARRRRDFASAAAYARRLLGEDAWREDVVRALIAVRYESGDRSGALREYEAFAQRLRLEFGIEPMPETILLREAVVRGVRPVSTLPAKGVRLVGRPTRLMRANG